MEQLPYIVAKNKMTGEFFSCSYEPFHERVTVISNEAFSVKPESTKYIFKDENAHWTFYKLKDVKKDKDQFYVAIDEDGSVEYEYFRTYDESFKPNI